MSVNASNIFILRGSPNSVQEKIDQLSENQKNRVLWSLPALAQKGEGFCFFLRGDDAVQFLKEQHDTGNFSNIAAILKKYYSKTSTLANAFRDKAKIPPIALQMTDPFDFGLNRLQDFLKKHPKTAVKKLYLP